MSVETELSLVGRLELELNEAHVVETELSLTAVVVPPPPLGLPQEAALQLYYDTREQGVLSIIKDTKSGEHMTRIGGGDFAYTASPPSVTMGVGVNARNASVPTARIRANDDGIQTIMMLLKPDSTFSSQFVLFKFGSSARAWDHIGVMSSPPKPGSNFFTAIEGNTSDDSERDGDAVAYKSRKLDAGYPVTFLTWGRPLALD